MITLSEIAAANKLLMSLGADDAMPKIAAVAIERSLEMQHRVDRALAYAEETPPNSLHARQMARILDGSITLDDELNEVPEPRGPLPERPARAALHAPAETPRRRGPGKKQQQKKGLGGRPKPERAEFRQWAAEQGFDIPLAGLVPQHYLDAFDEFKEIQRQQRAEARRPAPPAESLFNEEADG